MFSDSTVRTVTVKCDYCPEEYEANRITTTIEEGRDGKMVAADQMLKQRWFSIWLPTSKEFVETHMCDECIRKVIGRAKA